MKTLITVFLLLGFVSCSSTNKTGQPETDAVIAHVSQGEKVIGKDWDEKFTKDGFVNGEYIAIGSSNSRELNFGGKPLKLNAEAEATARLLKSAPTDFKKIVQRVISSLNNNDGYTVERNIAITEVRALTGMKSNYDDTQCVTTAVPTQDLKWSFNKECRVIVRIDATELRKAYDYTLDVKYGIKTKNEIDVLINKELNLNSSFEDKVSSNP